MTKRSLTMVESIGAGNALAVQNFAENISMLLFVGAYSLAETVLPINVIVGGFGLALLLLIGALTVIRVNPRKAQ